MSSSLSPTSSSSTTTSSPSSTDANASSDPTIASANYFFGFVVTFVVLLLLFIGCGAGSWRRVRVRIIDPAWDTRRVDEGPFRGRRRGRRKLVRPVFWETWMYTPAGGSSWAGVQPISAAVLWSRSRLASGQRHTVDSSSSPQTPSSRRNSPTPGFYMKLISYVNPRRQSRSDHPPKPPPPVERPPPDTVQVAVMISMPSPSSSMYGQAICGSSSNDAGQSSGVGEYQIGVMQLPWPNNAAS